MLSCLSSENDSFWALALFLALAGEGQEKVELELAKSLANLV
jgi:hypothetical protein